MSQDSATDWLVSEDELAHLTELNSLKTAKSTACPTSAGDARHPPSIPSAIHPNSASIASTDTSGPSHYFLSAVLRGMGHVVQSQKSTVSSGAPAQAAKTASPTQDALARPARGQRRREREGSD